MGDPWVRGAKRGRRHAAADGGGGIEKTSDCLETVTLPPHNGDPPPPPLVPTGKPTYCEALHDSLVDVACGHEADTRPIAPTSEPLNLFDLLHALQKHKKIIP